MPTLADLPLHKIPVIEPSAALDEAIRLLEDEPLKTVALVGDEQYMGLFSQDALDSSLVPPGADLSTLQVGPYIHPVRAVGHPAMSVADALALMQRRGVAVLPVVRTVTFLGLVIRADVEAAAR